MGVGAIDAMATPALPERAVPIVDDDAIAVRAKGDLAAFAPLYERYLTPVYGYCRLRLDSVEAAEDATAAVFAKALAALPDYRPTKQAGFRAWLFTIAHRVVTDVYRERTRRPSLPIAAAEAVPDRAADPEGQTLAALDAAELRAALGTLPDDQRRVVELRLAGLTDREIAVALGRGHGAIRMTQLRAVRGLRARLLPPDAEGIAR